jgi:hypothetical protein
MKGHSVVLIPVLTNVTKILDLCTEYTYKKYIHEMKVFLHWDNHVATQSWTIPISSSTAQCKKFICDTLRALHIPIPKYIKLVKTVANRHVYILLYTESSTISKSLEKQFPVSKDGYRAWKWRTYWHTYYPWEDAVHSEDDSDEDENCDTHDGGEQTLEDDMEKLSLHENGAVIIPQEAEERKNIPTDKATNIMNKQENATLDGNNSKDEVSDDQIDEENVTIPVYDYIIEDTQLNQYHMKETYPLWSDEVPMKNEDPHTTEKSNVSLGELCSALSDINIEKLTRNA